MPEHRYILVDELEYAASGEMQKAQFIDMRYAAIQSSLLLFV